jgi:hypothetical protein
MEATTAGGRNTQTGWAPGVASLETDLENVAAAVSALLADARAMDPKRDEFGHARSRVYNNAVALLKVSAKLGHSIAALRGSKFEHNINVRREDPRIGDRSGPLIEYVEEPPECECLKYQGCDYNPSVHLSDGKVFVRGKGWMHVPEDWNEERWLAGLPQSAEEGTPLPISRGSNGNFGNSGSGEEAARKAERE